MMLLASATSKEMCHKNQHGNRASTLHPKITFEAHLLKKSKRNTETHKQTLHSSILGEVVCKQQPVCFLQFRPFSILWPEFFDSLRTKQGITFTDFFL